MYMYRIEVEMEHKSGYVVIVASDEAEAYDQAETTIIRHDIVPPVIKSMAITEKKRVSIGAGYFFEAEIQ